VLPNPSDKWGTEEIHTLLTTQPGLPQNGYIAYRPIVRAIVSFIEYRRAHLCQQHELEVLTVAYSIYILVFLSGVDGADQKCNETILMGHFGHINYLPSPVNNLLQRQCTWTIDLTEKKDFLFVLQFDSLMNYGRADQIFLPDGKYTPFNTHVCRAFSGKRVRTTYYDHIGGRK